MNEGVPGLFEWRAQRGVGAMADYKPHPLRIQRKRTKGWKLPEDAVIVTRPTKWGNPFVVGKLSDFGDVPDPETAVAFYRATVDKGLMRIKIRQELRGKKLACYCPLDRPCHADVLAELAND